MSFEKYRKVLNIFRIGEQKMLNIIIHDFLINKMINKLR